MRQTQSAVLERGFVFEGSHATEPFEVAWAEEARFYVQFYLPAPDTRVSLQVQISPDGLTWLDHESDAVECDAEGWVTIRVRDFGFWLRLSSTRVAGSGTPTMKVYLQVKE